MAELTADEAAVYDRQLRVWGLETQQKLGRSKVLIVGCSGLAAEIAKNVVLAGVGSLTLVDDTPCSAAPPGNFLVPHDAKDPQTVAEACVATLQEMNPLVKVQAAAGSPFTYCTAVNIANYNIAVLVGQNGAVIDAADKACCQTKVPILASVSGGMAGWTFANLHIHDYIVENKIEQSDGTTKKTTEQRQIQGVGWADALTATMEKRNIKRMSHLLPIIRVCAKFEQTHSRPVSESDLPAVQAQVDALCQAEGLNSSAIESFALPSYIAQSEEMPAINAILGGVVANDIIKIVAAKGEPVINNLFLYSLLDGAGWVERLG